MAMSKRKKIIIITSSIMSVVLLGVLITVCVLFVPLSGSKYENLWSGINQSYDITKDAVKIEKKADKDFVIAQLTDMQLWSNAKDNKKAFEVAESVIKVTEPDLVVFTGDNVSGVGIPSLLKQFIEKIEELAEKYNFNWAPIFGNHDNEVKATPNWSGDQYLKVSRENGGHCLFQKGPTNLGDEYGDLLGNYVINVMEGEEIVQSLYMLDNSVYANYPEEIKDKVLKEENRTNKERPFPKQQIEWCKWQATNINKIAGREVPSLFFTHCAPYEMGNVLLKYVAGKDGKINTNDDMAKDKEGFWSVPIKSTGDILGADSEQNDFSYPMIDGKELIGINGKFKYVPSHALVNTGIVESMKPLGLKGWFVGHDHENDIVFKYDDIVYGYGLKAGPSPKPWNDSALFGGTKLVMDKTGNIETSHIVTDLAKNYWDKR